MPEQLTPSLCTLTCPKDIPKLELVPVVYFLDTCTVRKLQRAGGSRSTPRGSWLFALYKALAARAFSHPAKRIMTSVHGDDFGRPQMGSGLV